MKGKKEGRDNYRLISLTSMTAKIMEIILGATEKHLKQCSHWSKPTYADEGKVMPD